MGTMLLIDPFDMSSKACLSCHARVPDTAQGVLVYCPLAPQASCTGHLGCQRPLPLLLLVEASALPDKRLTAYFHPFIDP